MIPTQTFEAYPVFGDNGQKEAPDSAKYSAGFQPADVLPAEWMNWAWNHNTKGITTLNQGLLAVEQELNAILTAGGAVPNNTSGQVLDAIKYVIEQKTGILTNLQTTAKGTIVAACNEILGALNTHKADHTNPHQVGGSQLSDPVPTDKIEDGAVTSPKVNQSVYTYSRVLYGECTTPASTQNKAVTIANLAEGAIPVGVEIRVKFTNGSTYLYEAGGDANWGQCYGLQGTTGTASENTIREVAAPKLVVNGGTAYPIKIGGEYAGEGFIQAGDVHTFVFDGSAWNDMTSDVIYQGSTSAGNYVKKRNGFITEKFRLINSNNALIYSDNQTVDFFVPFTEIPFFNVYQRYEYPSSGTTRLLLPGSVTVNNWKMKRQNAAIGDLQGTASCFSFEGY